ncbi:MAG: hypothetical protein V3V45_03790 [Candidatus Brocadiales bacterium]
MMGQIRLIHKTAITVGLFLLLVSGGCAQGPPEEEGINFRTSTMQWPNLIQGAQEPQGALGNMEQR